MSKSSTILFDRPELRLVECQVEFSGVPVQASLNIKNGSNGDLTLTSKKGEDIGNATSMTFTMSTNAASVAISDYAISADLHKDGTNAFSDTTASNVKTLLEANSNIAALVTVTTNTAGIMASATKALLAGGDDKITFVSPKVDAELVRNSIGSFSLTLNSDRLIDYAGSFGGVSCTTAGTYSGISSVEVVAVDDDTFTISMFDNSAALANVDSKSVMHLFLLGQNSAIS